MVDNWDRLRVFAAVARHGSVRGAAGELHLTGPAVSHHLRRLERELGTALVEPAGRGIRLTVAGRVLAGRAADAGAAVVAASAQIEALADTVSGPVRLGASGTVLRRLAPVLGEYQAAHPEVRPEVIDAETIDLLPRLRRDELDLVVGESWSAAPRTADEGLTSTPLRSERVWVAVPAAHPAAESDIVHLAGLVEQPWVSCAEGSDPYRALGALISAEGGGATPRIAFRVNDFATALAIVEAGLAFALVTDLSRPDGGAGVALRPIDPEVVRTLSLIGRRAPERPAVARLRAAVVTALA